MSLPSITGGFLCTSALVSILETVFLYLDGGMPNSLEKLLLKCEASTKLSLSAMFSIVKSVKHNSFFASISLAFCMYSDGDSWI